MKKFSFFSIILFASFCAFATDDSPFLHPQPHGGVKSYTETNFEITTKFGDYYKTPRVKFQHNFNENGLETESVEYSATNKLISKTIYTYNDDGKIALQICYDDKENAIWQISTTFDSNGDKLEESEFDGKDNLTGKSVYKNESGNLVEETYYNSKGELIWKNIYKYSDANQLEESFSYFSNGRLDTRCTYKYDKFGKLLEITSFDASDKILSNEVFAYNDDDTVNEYTVYGADGKRRTRIFYKYDENKNCVKSTTYNVAQKFGTTVNEMVDQSDFEYEYR